MITKMTIHQNRRTSIMKSIVSYALLSVIIASSAHICEAKRLKVDISKAGTLSEVLANETADQITSLTITGTMDDADIKALQSLPNLQELALPPMVMALNPSDAGLTRLKRIAYDNVDYVPGHTFADLPELEEVVFNGLVGHTDGYMFFDCENLKNVTFNGPVISTGGSLYLRNCPKIKNVTFNDLVISTGFGENDNCPAFEGYSVNGMVHTSQNQDFIAQTDRKSIAKNRKSYRTQLESITDWFNKWLRYEGGELIFLYRMASNNVERMNDLLKLTDNDDLTITPPQPTEKQIEWTCSKLDLLKRSAAYAPDTRALPEMTYADASDSLLSLTREYFNLDSIAGQGDELSRIMNMLHWVHNNISHDGSSKWPDCKLNSRELYEVCKRENRGINCRLMAIMLTEMLLAEGIPARYLTCQPKLQPDPDCHVIAVAWSSQLNKWIWIDPTFDAIVTDENDNLLHPGEVRERMISGKPLKINEDANWNNTSKQTIDNYIYYYMAKNLYYISCNTMNQSEPEGRGSGHVQGHQIMLAPTGTEGENVTTDDTYFWQAPKKH